MTAVFAPFGIRPTNDPSWRGRVKRFDNAIASGYNQNIFQGSAVKLVNGQFELVTSVIDEIYGVVSGFAWRDQLGNEVIQNNWTAGTLATNVRLDLYTEAGAIFEVQVDGQIDQTALGQMLALTNFTAGDVRNGASKAAASSSVLSSDGQMVIIGRSEAVNNAFGDAFPIVQVRFPTLGAATVGVGGGGGGGGGPPLASTTPSDVGISGQVGTSPAAARADHVHGHGNLPGGDLHALATVSAPGFMSAADKTKVNSIETGATATPLAIATPLPVGTAAVGVAARAAREDHVHSLSLSGVTAGAYTITNFTVNSFGIITAASSTPTSGPNSLVFRDNSSKIAVADLPAFLINDVYEAGTEAAMLALPAAQGDVALRTDVNKSFVLAAAPASTLSNWKELLFPPIPGSVTSVFGLGGPSVTIPGLLSLGGSMDPMDEFPVYDASTATHRRVPFSVIGAGFLPVTYTPPLATGSTNGAVTAADFTKLQGLQNTPLASTAPQAVGAANVTGVGTTAARADHIHAHGDQLGGTLHAEATITTAGFMSAADKAKLNGLLAGGIATITAVTNSGIVIAGPDAQNRTVALNASNMAVETGLLLAGTAGFVLYDQATGLPLKATQNALVPALAALAAPLETALLITSTAAGSFNRTTVAQLFTDRVLLRPTFTGALETKQARTDISGSGTLPPFTGQNTYHYRLTGNATLTLPAAPVAANTFLGITVIIEQDGTGARTCLLNAPPGDVIKWDGGTVPTMATAAAARTKIVFTKAQGETRWDGLVVFKDA